LVRIECAEHDVGATRSFPNRREEAEVSLACNARIRGNLRTLAHEEKLHGEGVVRWHSLLDGVEHLPGGAREDTPQED
jgi:hypothetical protein